MTFFILSTGFLTSASNMSYAQDMGIFDLPLLDYNIDSNDKLKELYDMVPNLNDEDTSNEPLGADSDPKDYEIKPSDSVDSDTENHNDIKITDADDSFYSDDNILANTSKQDSKNNDIESTPSITSSSILSSILDKLPYSNVLPDLAHSPSSSSPSANTDSKMGEVIPGQYIVVLKEDTHNIREILVDISKRVNLEGTKVLHIYEDVLNGFSINVPNERIIDILEQSPFVEHIEKDKVVEAFAQTLPSGINRVDGDLSYTRAGNGGGSVNADIAILDTGIHTSHSDLNVYHQKTLVSGTSSANDDNGHGTHIAGIAAAKDNSIGVVGIAPGAKLWAIKVLDRNGAGALSTVIKGIDYIRQYANQIEVANLSLGCQCKSTAFDTAINNAVKAGITFVVAAGNSGKDASTFSPANHPNVIAVSAIGDSDGKCGGFGPSTGSGGDDKLASFSNYGSVIDIAAPGVEIFSTYKSNSYATMSGTSMAAPHVAGAAALYEAAHSGVSPSEVRNALLNSGTTSSTLCDGNGRGYFTGDKDSSREKLLYVRNY